MQINCTQQKKNKKKRIVQQAHIHHKILRATDTMGQKMPPPQKKNCPLPWGSVQPSNTWFLVPTRVCAPNGVSIGSAVLAQLVVVTDRQTDHTDGTALTTRRIFEVCVCHAA